MTDAVRLKFEQICPDCQGRDFVEDHAQGDLICRDKESVDPSRVGGPTNHLLTDGLSTSIGEGTKGASSMGLANTLKRTHARSGDADRSLLVAFGHIGKICDAMSLVRSIKDTACELYKQISESRSIIGRGAAPVAAAVIYIACRNENMPRTFKEICAVVQDTNKKGDRACYKAIIKELETNVGVTHVSDYMRRWGSQLGLSNREMRAGTEIADVACPRDGIRPDGGTRPWDGKSPLSIAAAIIYVVSCIMQMRVDPAKPGALLPPVISEIAQVAGVAEGTIRGTYKTLYADLPGLIPAWFATPAEVQRLPQLGGGAS